MTSHTSSGERPMNATKELRVALTVADFEGRGRVLLHDPGSAAGGTVGSWGDTVARVGSPVAMQLTIFSDA
jgi:hypothetical protein